MIPELIHRLRLVRRPVIVLCPSIAVACGSSSPTSTSTGTSPGEAVVASATVVPASVALQVGDTLRLTAIALDEAGDTVADAEWSWSSDDEDVATVDGLGLVTAEGAGVAELTATTGGVSDTATVTVSSVAQRTVFFTETFESSQASSRGWFDGSSGNWTLSSTEFHGGSKSLEWHWQSGEIYPEFGGTSRKLFSETESVYLSYWVKYSANWVGSGQPYHPHELYLLTNADDQWIGPSRTHLTAYIEHNYQGGLRPVVSIQDALNIDETKVGSDLTGVTEQRAVAGCNGNSDGYPTDCYSSGANTHNNGKAWRGSVYLDDTPGPTYKNDWHFIEAYVQLNSIVNGIGQNDGVVRYWIDGNLLIDIDDALLRTGAQPAMAFREIILGPYIGPGSPATQSVWIDDLTVADQR